MSKLADKIFRRSGWYVTSPFGYRKDPFGSGATTFHNGTDYGTNVQKWEQYAIEDGYVRSAGTDSSGSKYVYVCYPRIGKELLHYHLDSIACKTGDKVTEGTLLGKTGTTGNSTGIHLHLGLRNIGGTTWEDPHAYDYQTGSTPTPNPTKTVDELAKEVIAGNWGNGDDRKNRLTQAGYDYNAVQKRVNELLSGSQPKPQPSIDLLDLVRKTIRGDFGNGDVRKQKLGSNYSEVQRQVNLNIKAGLTRWDNIKIF